jgi:hypothetical protein
MFYVSTPLKPMIILITIQRLLIYNILRNCLKKIKNFTGSMKGAGLPAGWFRSF